MAQGTVSDYLPLPSFIASTRSVLHPKNRDLKRFEHAIVYAFFRQIGTLTVINQQKIVDLFNITKERIKHKEFLKIKAFC